MKRELINFALYLTGRPAFQPFWEFLHRVSLAGMNYGRGTLTSDSGERWVLDHLSPWTKNRDSLVFFDVGANVGDYSDELIKRFGNKVNLYSFEPSPTAFAALKARLGAHANVSLFNYGFGEREESVTLYSPKEGSGIASVYCRRLEHRGVTMKCHEQIQVKTLDNFSQEHNIRYIDFLKLDVEGHELQVLKGGLNLIKSNSIGMIQFEFGGCNIDSKTYLQDFYYLLGPYYQIYRILKYGIYKLKTYRETDEIFTTTNYLAISKENKLPY